MTKSTGNSKGLVPPGEVLPELPPYIPRNFPFVQKEKGVETVDKQGEIDGTDEDALPSEDESTREKRQATGETSSATKPTYCDGVDEIGCYQVCTYRFNCTSIQR